MTLKLVNSLTKSETLITGLTDTQSSHINYVIELTLPEGMDTGEYEYTLMDEDDAILATGLLQIGEYVPEKQTYTAQTKNNYVQYEG